MRSERASFWAGFSLGVTVVAAAVGARLWWEWYGWESENRYDPDDVDYPVDRPQYLADQREYLALVDVPEVRASFETGGLYHAPPPKIWCPGVDPTRAVPDLPSDRTWEPCTATIRHDAHVRYDRLQPRSGEPDAEDSPEEEFCQFHWPSEMSHADGSYDPARHTCFEDLDHGSEHQCSCGATAPRGVAPSAVPDWVSPFAQIQAPVIDPDAMEKLRESARAALAGLGEAFRPLREFLASGGEHQCDRDHPHPVHVWEEGVCPGIRPPVVHTPFAGTADPDTGADPFGMGLVANWAQGWCGQWYEHGPHSYVTSVEREITADSYPMSIGLTTAPCVGVRRRAGD